MARKRGGKPRKKKGGVMSGLRGGFRSAVRGATGVGEDADKKKAPSRFSKIFWNVVTGVMLIVVAAVWARRCGIVKW